MKFTREQVIEMANDCGLVGYGEDAGEYRIPAAAFHARMERLCALAADAALDAAIGVCHVQQDIQATEGRAVVAACCAASIRDMKEKP